MNYFHNRIAQLFFLSSICILLLGCSPYGHKYDKTLQKIIFGSGGGFTGKVTAYDLDINRKRLRKKGEEEEQKIKRKRIKHITRLLNKHEIPKLYFNKPYNNYKFIHLIYEEREIKYVWGDPKNPAPEALVELYEELVKLVNQ